MRDENLYNFWPAAVSCTYANCVAMCVHEHVGNFMPRRQMSQHTTAQAGRQFSLAKILASACLLKCKIVQLRNCFAPRDCQHSAAVPSSRSFAVFGSQFSARHLRLATLMQFSLDFRAQYFVCFCFCCFAHTQTPGVTRGQSLRQRHLKAILHSFSLNLSCCIIVAF